MGKSATAGQTNTVLLESYKTPAIFNPYRHQDYIHMHAVTRLLATLGSESYVG